MSLSQSIASAQPSFADNVIDLIVCLQIHVTAYYAAAINCGLRCIVPIRPTLDRRSSDGKFHLPTQFSKVILQR